MLRITQLNEVNQQISSFYEIVNICYYNELISKICVVQKTCPVTIIRTRHPHNLPLKNQSLIQHLINDLI